MLPALPLVLEYVGEGFKISEKSFSIFMAIYVLCIGTQSKKSSFVWISVIVGTILSFYYGLSFRTKTEHVDFSQSILSITLIVFFVAAVLERLDRL